MSTDEVMALPVLQAAARAAAAAMASQVPNGLTIGGLAPAVTQITSAADDPTGIRTWQGAQLPTADAGDPNQVKVVQTDARAILSWETFNVGRETTLTFQQTSNGVAQPSWVALNRVVGQINPLTGLRDPNSAPAPSQILGAIKADGTVLVINQNGVIFGPTAQVNVHSLIATSLEVGHALEASGPITLQQRNTEFLNLGLLGYVDQAPDTPNKATFSAQEIANFVYDPLLEGTVEVSEGAAINSADGGFLLFIAPRVVNGGRLTSPDGQVSLQSGRDVVLTRSQGDVNSVDPDLRGLALKGTSLKPAGDYVNNLANGIIEAPGGYVSLGATLTSGTTPGGAVLDAGVLSSTTSVSRNGYVNLYGGDIELAPGAVIAITPDEGPATIPQDPTSLGAFKTSRIRIGDTGARIDIGANSLIYAPSADISIGADPGQETTTDAGALQASRVFIDSGAIIDASGLKDVFIPASRNLIQIRPVKQNELRDTPDYRLSFLNGATVLVDPRLSGVRADGVAWVGSPLIEAASYYQQVGVTASELMTTGGNVTLGAASHAAGGDVSQAADVIVKAGASIDISGGWRTFQAGVVQTSRLVNANGQVIDIAYANPNDTYVAVYNGFTSVQPRWGITRTYVDPLLSGAHAVGEYSEGRDAGSLTIKASVAALDGRVFADAFAGPKQTLDAQAGTGAGTVYGDVRRLQAAPSQLPAGGYLNVQALGIDFNSQPTGGGDIAIVGSEDYRPVGSDFAYGQEISFAADGTLIVPTRPPGSVLPIERLSVISLDAGALSAMGLSQLTVQTSGKIDVTAGAEVDLAPGGAFEALSGRTLTIDGRIVTPGGSIDLATAHFAAGSVTVPEPEGPGSYDIVINGQLNVAGSWANDFNASAESIVGSAYLNGGEITLMAAPRVAPLDTTVLVTDPDAPTESLDISGSLLINDGATLNLSGGGYVRPDGGFNLSAKGGNLSLFDETTYFQLADDGGQRFPGGLSGFRVTTIPGPQGSSNVVAVNPSAVNARVVIAEGSILAHGFAGGGTFSLTTPQFQFGDGSPATGAELPLDFFSKTGFAAYDIKSYKTDLIPNAFDNGLGGFNAVLATQVVAVGAGQTLSLTQSVFSPLLDAAHIATLRGFATGGDLNSILTPVIPTEAWDRRAVNLTLGGLMELHVAGGGSVVGEAGGALTVGELWNEGAIRIPGGALTQSEILPSLYVGSNKVVAVHSLSDVFTTRADGTIAETDPNALGLKDLGGTVLTNGQVAGNDYIYLLGDLDAGEGVRLASGSVTDLSGAAIVNPRAAPRGGAPIAGFVDGVVVAGGALATAGAFVNGPNLFHAPLGQSVYAAYPVIGSGATDVLNADPGSLIDLSGATATFDRPAVSDFISGQGAAPGYAPTLVWSNGGALTLGSGGTIAGADIRAAGGTPAALGGMLTVLDPVLYQSDPDTPTFDAISADAVARAGFDTFVAQGSLSSIGDVKFAVRRGVFVTARPNSDGGAVSLPAYRDSHSPVIRSGGALEIDAAYIGLEGAFQALSTPLGGIAGDNSVTFNADTIDVTGAVRFDQSVGEATLSATGDVRLIGVEPWQLVFNSATPVPSSLAGQLAVNGNLTIRAARVYPTTGSSFTITSAAEDGLISFASSARANPATPYSAGGGLTVQAAHILQDGVIRVPLGSLTLGGDAPLQLTDGDTTSVFAPATQSLTLTPGSVTSVSADGLVIPYGTTTDQIEWFFNPTQSEKLTAPPAAVLRLAGDDIAVQGGATVDLTGGGDVYAYEFVSGTGGSRDVLSRFNPDVFSGNNGFQYPDHRQVYAIVPGLSDAAAAPFDPIYSADYAGLYGASDAGKRVYLSAAPGLAAGWYTLLPAQYALLPGGLRVVEDTGAAMPPPAGGAVLRDGTIVVAGTYGDAGAGTREATPRVFDVQTQDVFRKESNIALTYGNATFAAAAAHAGQTAPRLPIDAGRLILQPGQSLALDASIQTAAAAGGRGAQVDISGAALDIVGAAGGGDAGGIVLTAASLSNLNAASLLIGGVRTDNADGTTSLDVTTNAITVAGDATLAAPEIILATDGQNAGLIIEDGASIVASGTVSDPRTGAYLIDGLAADAKGVQTRVQSAQGAFLRVANGPERLVLRSDADTTVTPGALDLGAATLQGGSITLESSGDFHASPGVRFVADSLALGAPSITFAADADGLQGLVITPALQALIGQTKSLTIFTPNAIAFQSGAYRFGDVILDAPGLADLGGGPVTLGAGALELANSSGVDGGACGSAGAPLCGAGALTISAASIAFGSGNVRTYG
ncbi:MAG: filamentous hemagglutinin N-terminal domain-containing protein, partial [Caulobacteraceae bacterium]|nr:filamentous hemagglutinin N-terminal domain-containing protein [Caulobacteraceae bacterium]